MAGRAALRCSRLAFAVFALVVGVHGCFGALLIFAIRHWGGGELDAAIFVAVSLLVLGWTLATVAAGHATMLRRRRAAVWWGLALLLPWSGLCLFMLRHFLRILVLGLGYSGDAETLLWVVERAKYAWPPAMLLLAWGSWAVGTRAAGRLSWAAPPSPPR